MSNLSTPRAGASASYLLLALFVAILVRGVVLFRSLDSFNADPDSYQKLADNWRAFGVFGNGTTPTAFRPPLYPASLKALIYLRSGADRPEKAQERGERPSESKWQNFFDAKLALNKNASIALWHWLLGLATVALVFEIAVNVGLSKKLAFLASLLVAVDPILLGQSRLVMTETMAAFFAAASLLVVLRAVKRREVARAPLPYLALGLLLGLAILCRPAFFAFAALVGLNLLVVEFVDRRKSPALRIAAFLCGLALVVAPWTIRNYRVFNRPIATTTHDGYTLMLANNPELYQHYQTANPFSLWDPTSFHKRSEREYAEALNEKGIVPGSVDEELFQNEWTRAKALETIREDRSVFLFSCLVRACELWRVVPHDVDAAGTLKTTRTSANTAEKNKLFEKARLGVGVFYVLELSLAFLGALKLWLARRKKKSPEASPRSAFLSPWIWGFLLVFSVQIPHLFFWTNMRMRAPLEVFLPLVAVYLFMREKPTDSEENKATIID